MSKGMSIQERIRRGKIRQTDVMRRLAELAYGPVNDCVRLVMEEGLTKETLDGMDLRLVSEIRRTDKGAVEVKLVDRLQVLRQMEELAGDEEGAAAGLVEALRGSK